MENAAIVFAVIITAQPRHGFNVFLSSFPFCYICRMRRFAYCKVVLATSLVWVMLDMFILLYFSECNKCDDKKERGLPGRDGESTRTNMHVMAQMHSHVYQHPLWSTPCVCDLIVDALSRPRDGPGEGGKPVVIPKENQEKMKEMFKINQFNLMASEMIALNRSLPDVRLEGWAASQSLNSLKGCQSGTKPAWVTVSQWATVKVS